MNETANFFDRPRSADEVAEYLGSSRNFVIAQIHSKKLRAIMVGGRFIRILPADLRAWLDKNANVAA